MLHINTLRPLAFLLFSCFSLSANAQTTVPLFPKLSKTLDSLAVVDQRPMQEMMSGPMSASTGQRLEEEQKQNSIRHQPVLEAIIRKYGFPGFKQVGERSSGNFWLLVQHADAHPDFQRLVLKLMQPEVLRKNASPMNYAYLIDRVAMNAGQLQEYGTQLTYPSANNPVPRPIRDPENVNKRCAAVGMETLEAYLERMGNKSR